MGNQYADVGFEPDTNAEDLGFVADKPAESTINPLEMQLQQEKEAKAAAEQKAAQQQAAAEAAKNDPKNWTLKQTQDHFKDNPPQTPQEEAQAKVVLDQKKKELKDATESIQNRPPDSFKQVIGDLVHSFWSGDTPESRSIRGDRAYVMSKMFDVPLSVINKNYETYAKYMASSDKKGAFNDMVGAPDEGQVGAKKLLSAMVIPPISAAVVANPLATGLATAGFGILAEGENALIGKLKSEKYQFMRGLTAKDLAPAEAAPVTKDLIDMAEFVAQLGIGVGMFHGANAMAPPGTKLSEVPKNTVELMARFAKDLITNYKLPKTMYLPTASGEDVQVPTENVMRLAMGKSWKSIKDELSVAPTPKEEVAAKKADHEEAMTAQAKKDLDFIEEDQAAEGSETGTPSKSSVASSLPEAGTKEPLSNLETVVGKPNASASIRYTSPSSFTNLEAIDHSLSPHEKLSTLRKLSQENMPAFVQELANATGTSVEGRVKSADSLLGKIERYNLQGKNPSEIADTLAARVITDEGSIKQQIENVAKGFDVQEVTDFFKTPTAFGYRGINIKVKLPNGMPAEVQIHTPDSLAKATEIHKIYERWRNKDIGNLSAEEKTQYLKDMQQSASIASAPPKAPGKTAVGSAPEGVLKERKFITSVKEAPKTAPEVAGEVKGEYQPISNEQSLAEAKDILLTDPNGAQAAVEGPGRPTRVTNTIAQLLIDKAQNEGRFEDAIRLVETTARKNTELGQTIQALAMYSRLTPEGILHYATKQLEVGKVKIDPKFGEELVNRAKKLQEMPEGRDKDIETALILKDIAAKVPANLLRKISMVQTLAQLLNPKTMIRNLLGNVVFMGTDNLAQTVGTALDVATSLATGKRTLYMPDVVTQAQGMAQGFKEGTQEALLGINLKKTGSKFDLPLNSVFDKGVMAGLEKTLSVALGATDRAFYQAAFNDSIRMQMKGAGITEPTGEMIERAHYDGLYRTFQDDNVVSRIFVGLKKTLNAGKDWGFGDMVIKYPKTPAALLARGIEYSPFGFVSTAMEVAKPLFGKPFDQLKFVQSTSRALTGTALLIGSGAILGRLGIISGKRNSDKDVVATQQKVGIREYQINIDALKRFVASGFDSKAAQLRKGDTLVTYDWMQPASIGLAMGANMFLDPTKNVAQKAVDLASNIGNHLLKAFETLEGQPLVQGLKTLSGKESLAEGIAASIEGIPASFVPTLLNQVRQLTDNISRNTKDPNYFKEVENKAINKVPGVSPSIQARLTPLGQPQEMYQAGSNNPFNVFLNPAFVSKYNPDPISEMVLGIWERSGNTAQFPRAVGAKIKIGKESMELTPEQYNKFQSYVGHKTTVLFGLLAANPVWMKPGALPDDYKAKKLQGMLSDINTAGKIEVLGYQPKQIHNDVATIIRSIARDVQKIDHNDIKSQFDFTPDSSQ